VALTFSRDCGILNSIKEQEDRLGSFKVAVDTGEGHPSYNALRFATEDEAKGYGENLFMRWMAMKGYTAEPSDDPVSHKFVDGRLVPVA
jgi:hypothetical protein